MHNLLCSQLTFRRVPLHCSYDDLARKVHYCNLLIESVVTESAVRDLIVEVLTHQGPLPMDDLSAALSTVTGIDGFTSKLYEVVAGGLRGLLLKDNGTFILGTDDVRNPHVLLRSSLSAEDLTHFDAGLFLTHLVMQLKKVRGFHTAPF